MGNVLPTKVRVMGFVLIVHRTILGENILRILIIEGSTVYEVAVPPLLQVLV